MNKVEEVARAIDPEAFTAWQRAFDYEIGCSGDQQEALKFANWSQDLSKVRDKARAAIEAMGTPSKDMTLQGLIGLVTSMGERPKRENCESDEQYEAERWMHIGSTMRDGNEVNATWQAMIRAALTEGE